ncbi:cytochrome P450 [Catellatospora sp. TT07R-123]|uniref:cytochrome P450 n=1 Tax=Catellatospora sp. TT07R-123 TaxID=2733863 RepID=UPI001AFE2800|nr:cytochrome P450 [Catellatospora sp. TT07R-123]GHJ45042.1 cytochrome P450 [Catellatospora sp. TT07R-123]
MDALAAIQTLATAEGRADPYPQYERLRAAGPVVALGEGFFVVTGHQQADRVLRDPSFLVTDEAALERTLPGWRSSAAWRWLGRTMLWRNPPDHGRLRRLAGAAFTARRTAQLRPDVVRLVDGLIDAMGGPGPVDFMDAFAFPLPVAVICTLLGVPESDRDWFRPRAHDLTLALEMFAADPDSMARADEAATDLEDYFVGLLAHRRAHPGDDMLSDLLAAGAAGQIGGAEMVAHLALLLVAGFETTVNLLGNGLSALLARPALTAELRAHPELAGAYVEEMLRFDPPVQATSRFAGQDTDLDGVRIPADGEVMVILAAAARDPRRYPRPERFDPHRDSVPSLSFGAGAHYCLGAPLARLEAQTAFPMLLRRLPRLRLAGPAVRRDRLGFRGFAELPVLDG